MNFLFFLFGSGLFFVSPPTLKPTGVYLSGDPDVISIADGSQRVNEYRVPQDIVGAQVKVKLADGSPLNIYMNRDDASFDKIVNPPMNELTEEKVGLVSLSDEKLIMILHSNLSKEKLGQKDWSINNTIDVVNSLNKSIHMRAQIRSGRNISKKELREIKQNVENTREKGLFEKLKVTASVSPRMTQTQALSDHSDTD